MEEELIRSVAHNVFHAIPYLLQLPTRRLWIDYDDEADVLYISLERPQRATDSELSEEGILYRYRDERLVGLTILDAATRLGIAED